MADRVVDYEALGQSERERLTLRVSPTIKSELKRQARVLGVSPSAYVSMLVAERSDRFRDDGE